MSSAVNVFVHAICTRSKKCLAQKLARFGSPGWNPMIQSPLDSSWETGTKFPPWAVPKLHAGKNWWKLWYFSTTAWCFVVECLMVLQSLPSKWVFSVSFQVSREAVRPPGKLSSVFEEWLLELNEIAWWAIYGVCKLRHQRSGGSQYQGRKSTHSICAFISNGSTQAHLIRRIIMCN